MPLKGCGMRSDSAGVKKIGIVTRLVHLMRFGVDPKYAEAERRLDEITREQKLRDDMHHMNGHGR